MFITETQISIDYNSKSNRRLGRWYYIRLMDTTDEPGFFFCWSNFAINLIVLKRYIKWTHSETWRIRTTVNRGLRLSNKSIRSLYWMTREHLKSFILIVKKVNSIINCKFYSFYMWEIWTGSRALALSILYSHFQFGPFFPTLWTPIESKATEYIVSRWLNYEYKNMQHFIYVMR